MTSDLTFKFLKVILTILGHSFHFHAILLIEEVIVVAWCKTSWTHIGGSLVHPSLWGHHSWRSREGWWWSTWRPLGSRWCSLALGAIGWLAAGQNGTALVEAENTELTYLTQTTPVDCLKNLPDGQLLCQLSSGLNFDLKQ